MSAKKAWTLAAVAAGLFAFIFFVERHWQTAPPGPQEMLPHLRPDAVTSVQVRPAGQLEMRAERSNGVWEITRPVAYPGYQPAIDALLQALQQIVPVAHVTAQDLRERKDVDQEFGLDTPRATLLIQQGDHRTQLHIGKTTPMGDQLFVQVVGVEGIFLVESELMRFIPSEPDQWRDPAFVLRKDIQFDRLVITNAGKVVELQRDPTNRLWRIVRPDQVRADTAAVDALWQLLQGTRVAQFVTDDPRADLAAFGLQPAELDVTLAQGTNVVAGYQFGKSPTNDTRLVYARRRDRPAVMLVPREPIDAWRVPHNNLRDRHLVALTPGTVDVVEVKDGGGFTLNRISNDTWRVTAPETFRADTALVRDFFAELNNLQVAEFVKDVVTELDLPTYGLAPPQRQYILRRAGGESGTNTLVAQLEFGAASEDHVYARRADEGSVYAVKAGDFRRLLSEAWQLRDRRLWNFSTNDVHRITIESGGRTKQVQRDGPYKWSFGAGSQGVINDFAIEEIAYQLGELRAAAWVARGEKFRPLYGFAEKPPRVTVELKNGGNPQTLTVEFGGTAPSEFPYAAVTLDGQQLIFEFPWKLYQDLQLYLFDPAASNR